MATFTTGDVGITLTGTCSSKSGSTLTPTNITGATLALHITKPSGTVLTKTGVIVSGAAGTWSYTWAAGELDEGGAWTVEVQVTYSGGAIQTFGPTDFAVQTQLA